MTDGPPGRLATRRVYDGRVVRLDIDSIRAPDGSHLDLEIIRHAGASAVVPLLGDPQGDDPGVLLIRQYRYAAEGEIWEIPAGVLQPGEHPEACAQRELREETGARAQHLEYLTTIFTTPGFTDERIHLFLATDLERGEPQTEQDEFIEVEGRPLSRVLEMIHDGQLLDAKSIVALLFVARFRLRR